MTTLALGATFVACAEASGEIRGHEQAIDTTPPQFKVCGGSDDAGADAGGSSAYTDLYRDLFGPTSTANCSNTACHGSPDGAGTKATTFLCPGDAKQCRQGMIDYGLVSLERDPAAPEKSALIGVLRQCSDRGDVVGIMPQQPRSYVFSRASLDRIEAWIRQGAPDN
jgi:hypothetical protein